MIGKRLEQSDRLVISAWLDEMPERYASQGYALRTEVKMIAERVEKRTGVPANQVMGVVRVYDIDGYFWVVNDIRRRLSAELETGRRA